MNGHIGNDSTDMQSYYFRRIKVCEMCGTPSGEHKTLGLRLDKSQGLRPRQKDGIAVSVKRCGGCGLIYSQPQPVPHAVSQHYGIPAEDYWREDYFRWNEGYFSSQITNAIKLLGGQTGLRALDVGAGLGKAMLSLQNAGFEAFGCEPSEPYHTRAIEKMGISRERLALGMVEDLEFPDCFFDFVTFGAVFEHLYKPASCLERVLRWMRPGGVVHIEVPSAEWLVGRIVNLYYRSIGTSFVTNLSPMHAPFHLHEFTLKSFQELANKMHVKIEMAYYDVCEIRYVPRLLHPVLRSVMKYTNTGMQLTVYVRKL